MQETTTSQNAHGEERRTAGMLAVFNPFYLWILQSSLRDLKVKARILNVLDAPHSLLSVQKMMESGGGRDIVATSSTPATTYKCNHIKHFGVAMGGIWPKAFQKLAERPDFFTDRQCTDDLRTFQTDTTKPYPMEVIRALHDSGVGGKRVMTLWDADVTIEAERLDAECRQGAYESCDNAVIAGSFARFRETRTGFRWADLVMLGDLARTGEDITAAEKRGKEESKGVDCGVCDSLFYGPNDGGEMWNNASTFHEQWMAELDDACIGSASIGAVYNFPIFKRTSAESLKVDPEGGETDGDTMEGGETDGDTMKVHSGNSSKSYRTKKQISLVSKNHDMNSN